MTCLDVVENNFDTMFYTRDLLLSMSSFQAPFEPALCSYVYSPICLQRTFDKDKSLIRHPNMYDRPKFLKYARFAHTLNDAIGPWCHVCQRYNCEHMPIAIIEGRKVAYEYSALSIADQITPTP